MILIGFFGMIAAMNDRISTIRKKSMNEILVVRFNNFPSIVQVNSQNSQLCDT